MNPYFLSRASGILLHPTSLPSPYGIGDLGAEAYAFVDFLADAGQHLWQTLPLTHTGFGDSPYQSFSAFAGQPLLISPEHLVKLSLLNNSELESRPLGDLEHIDYGAVIPWKMQLLKRAYQRFLKSQDSSLFERYKKFCKENDCWLDDYSLFMACKEAEGGRSWLKWEKKLRQPSDEYLKHLRNILSEEAGFYRFIQFIYFEEWNSLKMYANDHGIRIIGDVPIFVSMDSADVWSNQHLFQVDAEGFPTRVAGVPPDYFSATGQLWGNPLYEWDAHKKEGFSWWISRIRHQFELFDILRIDHFRGFEAYWSVPYGEKTAVGGAWIKAPGHAFFQAVEHALGKNLPIIAEDLGVITPEVETLRDAFHFPGMKVLQFAFENVEENYFLPHQFRHPFCVCYTGTHDNDTTCGWFETLRPECQKKVRQYTAADTDAVSHAFIRTCLASIAVYAIFPLQDLLGLGKNARMNIPGTSAGNWNWRYKKEALTKELALKLKEMSRLYGRY